MCKLSGILTRANSGARREFPEGHLAAWPSKVNECSGDIAPTPSRIAAQMKLFTFEQISAFAATYLVLSTRFRAKADEVGRES